MNEEIFWNLVESAKNASSGLEDRPEKLGELLENLSADEIKQFDELYFDQIIKSYRWDLWGAAYVINGGCSDDGFKYFCDFLISEGKNIFEATLNDPESLASLEDIEDFELEGFSYVAPEIYESKAGSELPPYTKPHPSEPSGESWDEDGVDKFYPKLAAKYW